MTGDKYGDSRRLWTPISHRTLVTSYALVGRRVVAAVEVAQSRTTEVAHGAPCPGWQDPLPVGCHRSRPRRLPRLGVGRTAVGRGRLVRAALPRGVPERAVVAHRPGQARGLPACLPR